MVSMKVSLFTKELEELKTDALVIGFFDNIDSEDIQRYNNLSDGLFMELVNDKEFSGKFKQLSSIRLKGNIKRIILLGLGKREEFNLAKAREGAGKAAVYVRGLGAKEFSFVLYDDLNPYDAAFSIVEGVKLSLYQFLDFKTQNLEDIKKIEQFTLVANANNFVEVDQGIKEALVISDAVYYARDLQNNPSNVVTPTYLADEAKKLSRKFKINCKILDKRHMEKLGMGGILSVSKGSDHPPKLIILEYNPRGKKTICFVGKGITFDSGGISLKPSSKMDEMKFDMSGGATVFGIMQAVARLKSSYRVVGLIPASENLPGGKAYKPGDVVKFCNGKTAEIINTDAEGRVVLADALAYSKNFNPEVVVDFATLTGACVVSLGNVCSGMFSSDDETADKLLEVGEKSGECLWRLPLDKKYKEYIKSGVADIMNCGPRDAGAVTAAVFLQEFVECKKWVHLDIAGTAWTENNKDVLNPKGGTAVGVRLSLEFLKSLDS